MTVKPGTMTTIDMARGGSATASIRHRVAREVVDWSADGSRPEQVERPQNLQYFELLVGVDDLLLQQHQRAVLIVHREYRGLLEPQAFGAEAHRVALSAHLFRRNPDSLGQGTLRNQKRVPPHGDEPALGSDRF